MGSLGAARLNAASDLDLIVIYDAEGVEGSDGPRPLSISVYYARLTKALVTALSAPMARGAALRGRYAAAPLGAAGPGGDGAVVIQDLSAGGGVDLGASGADPRAPGRRVANFEEIEEFRRALLAEKAEWRGIAPTSRRCAPGCRPRSRGRARSMPRMGRGGCRISNSSRRWARCGPPRRAADRAAASRRPTGRSDRHRRPRRDSPAAYRLMWRIHCTLRLLGVRGPARPRRWAKALRRPCCCAKRGRRTWQASAPILPPGSGRSREDCRAGSARAGGDTLSRRFAELSAG
jgi:[glutamine synthetase] adenylyltransferase / [glutamine synthetase]-adenylyl-L-tyrosine phosphorylase